ncbi:hypothetical protein [Methylomonas sp. ZR1]|uniref:hypothetical protein n=1 Tax=Methylomonas sp. ZR1 TaxID=1797072 RepID=UPI001490F646|nr:hypothetical protein [Methylomonas sp. ZR1]
MEILFADGLHLAQQVWPNPSTPSAVYPKAYWKNTAREHWRANDKALKYRPLYSLWLFAVRYLGSNPDKTTYWLDHCLTPKAIANTPI